MESIEKVEVEIQKVLTKFLTISDHASKLISNEINSFELLKSSLMDDGKHLITYILTFNNH